MKFLGWLFIILCAQALSSLALEIFSTPRDTGSSLLPKHHIQEQETKSVKGTRSLHGESDGRGYMLKQVNVYSRKGTKGKGSYGGANIVHHPRPNERSAASLTKTSTFFILSSTTLYAGFSLALLFLF